MPTQIGLDTATAGTAVAAVRDGVTTFAAHIGAEPGDRPSHGASLMEQLEIAAEHCGGWGEVDRICAGVGPGSFTGIRIGLAAAMGVARTLGVACAGVGTLEAMGRAILSAEPGRMALPILDARRQELFAALYEPDGTVAWEPFVITPAGLTERLSGLGEAPFAAGDGTLRFRDELSGCGAEFAPDDDELHRVSAVDVCLLGAAAPAAGDRGLRPLYLREPDAERWHKRAGDRA